MDRRHFLKINAALFVSTAIGIAKASAVSQAGFVNKEHASELTSFIQINHTGEVCLFINQQEMGQGVRTAIAQLICEELGIAPELVTLKQAPAHPDKYGRQLTGGSGAIRRSWLPMRQAGAAAREMLTKVAAKKFNLPVEQCQVENGFVVNSLNGRKISFGDLVQEASLLPIPTDPTLKPKKDFVYVGKPHGGLDNQDIISGTAQFGGDFKLPGMRYAALVRSPTLKGQVENFFYDKGAINSHLVVYKQENLSLSEDMPQTRAAIVVVGPDSWSVIRGKEALSVEWKTGQIHHPDSDTLKTRLFQKSEEKGVVVRDQGEPLGEKNANCSANYYTPMQYQAQMEPMVCTALVSDGRCEIWAPVQWPHFVQKSVASFMNMPLENAVVNPLRMGGSFGRKYCDDFVIECVAIAKKHENTPIQLLWTREDDIQAGGPQIPCCHKMVAGVTEGRVTHWLHRLVQASPTLKQASPEAWQVEQGQTPIPYDFANIQCEFDALPFDMDTTAHRGVFYPTNAFAINSFMDELAVKKHTDAIEFHLKHLPENDTLVFADWQKGLPEHLAFKTQRLRTVSKAVQKMAGIKQEGVGRGFALQRAMFSYVATLVEVRFIEHRLRITDVYIAVDCGFVVNPNGAESQIEGSMIWGLSCALLEELTLKGGVVEQSNFHQYPVLSARQAPRLHLEIIDSGYEPTGLGEPVVTVMAPALANAIFNLTGQRIRSLPLAKYFDGEVG